MKKICLIGGGTSNLFSAIELNNTKFKVVLFEEKKIGSKLLASGNGRCNISNINLDNSKYFNSEFVKDILMSYKDIKYYLEEKGILLSDPDSDGRVYPYSYHSSIVLNKILELTNNIEFRKEKIEFIEKINDKFIVGNSNFKEEFDIVVIGTGGKLENQINNDLLYKSIFNFNHTITKTYPVISPLKVIENINTLNGIIKKAYLDIDLMPNVFLKDYFNFLLNNNKNIKSRQLLSGLFIDKLVNYILNISNLNGLEKVNDKIIDILIYNINHFKLNINLNKFSNIYQVVNGGINVNEINSNLESKLVNNLYFGGEIIDVDGYCGGYNLSFAISTGIKIANSIKKK